VRTIIPDSEFGLGGWRENGARTTAPPATPEPSGSGP